MAGRLLGVFIKGILEEEIARIGAMPAGQGPCPAGAGMGIGSNDRASGRRCVLRQAVWLFFHDCWGGLHLPAAETVLQL